jgi:endonuclease I
MRRNSFKKQKANNRQPRNKRGVISRVYFNVLVPFFIKLEDGTKQLLGYRNRVTLNPKLQQSNKDL